MQPLFSLKGKHIANYLNGQLYSTSGKNIGHYLSSQQIFIDMQGRYLGEIIYEKRLAYKTNSQYRSTSFGSYGNYGSIGNYGNYGSIGSISSISGYRDVEI